MDNILIIRSKELPNLRTHIKKIYFESDFNGNCNETKKYLCKLLVFSGFQYRTRIAVKVFAKVLLPQISLQCYF